MKSGFFATFFYQPIYNGLVFLISVVPGHNVGVSIITLTILVRSALLPLAHKSVVSQAKMRAITPHIEKLKEKHKDNKQEQAVKMMALYKEHGINPFSGLVLVLVQLPVIFALYFVFFKGLPHLNSDILYSFVHLDIPNMNFLGLDLTKKSALLAALAAIAQFFQIKLSVPPITVKEIKNGEKPSFKDEFAKSFNLQMRYILPLVVFGIGYSISSAIALYWATSNLFSIGHELYVKRKALGVIKESN